MPDDFTPNAQEGAWSGDVDGIKVLKDYFLERGTIDCKP